VAGPVETRLKLIDTKGFASYYRGSGFAFGEDLIFKENKDVRREHN
jgi:hypothetical protein